MTREELIDLILNNYDPSVQPDMQQLVLELSTENHDLRQKIVDLTREKAEVIDRLEVMSRNYTLLSNKYDEAIQPPKQYEHKPRGEAA